MRRLDRGIRNSGRCSPFLLTARRGVVLDVLAEATRMDGERSKLRIRRPEALPGVELLHAALVDPPSVRHLHADFRFGVSAGCHFRTRYRDRDHVAEPRRIQIAQPGEVSECSFAAGDTLLLRIITIPADQIAQLCGELSRGASGLPHFDDHLAGNEAVADRFIASHAALMHADSALESNAILCDLLELLIGRFASRPARLPGAEAPRAVRLARDYIEAHLDRNPSLAELADLVGLSPFHLNRSFRHEFGLPPHAYQNHRRIERAKLFLAAGHPGDEVAHDLGFADQSHFIRQFKKQLGLTPQIYRESVRC
ncbi:helix-turn-helix transcriptional regulator [Sphingomonas sp. DT-207]|uniref:helix-turn-helix transcriptional regulator n=1 Tax=Sphingomonas sp. DT-207 TaxID=3396167 RepID=UPI003F54021C